MKKQGRNIGTENGINTVLRIEQPAEETSQGEGNKPPKRRKLNLSQNGKYFFLLLQVLFFMKMPKGDKFNNKKVFSKMKKVIF